MTRLNLGALGHSDEQIDLMTVATDFCREKSPPEQVRKAMESDAGFDAALWQEMAGLGWLGIAIPEAQGGVGLTLAEAVPVVEQMGRRVLASPFVPTTLAAQALLAGASDAQKQLWLPRIAEGSIATLALAETNGDWQLSNIDAVAAPDGGGYVLSGTKSFVLWADAAELIVLSVKVEGELRLALVEATDIADGSLRRETIVDETRRSFEWTLDGIHVPGDRLMDAAKTAATLEHIERAAILLQVAEMVGGTQGAMEYTLDYLRNRTQFGKLIGEYQALKHPMADIYVDYEKARSHLYSAAHNFADPGVGEAATRMAKVAADRIYGHASDRAIQFHGGFGFTHDCDAQLYRRGAIWNASQFGDSAWHRAKLADLLF